MKKKILVVLMLSIIFFIAGCSEDNRADIKETINELNDYFSELSDIEIYFKEENLEEVRNNNKYIKYTDLSTITLTKNYTFIGYDVEETIPTQNEISSISKLFSENKKVSVCFFGTKDFEYLIPYYEIVSEGAGRTNYVNNEVLGECLSNYSPKSFSHGIEIDGIRFDDLPQDKLYYQFSILEIVERQIEIFYSSNGQSEL